MLGCLLFVYMWWKYPRNLEVMLSQVARLLVFLGAGAKRFQVKHSVQGRVNQQIIEFDAISQLYFPHGVSIEFVHEGVRRESFLRGNTVVCRMSYDRNPHLNYLHAALLYLKSGFVPNARHYLSADCRQAMDLAALDMTLKRTGDKAVERVFYDQILPFELQRSDRLKGFYETFLRIEGYGLFTHVFLPELLDFSVKTQNASPQTTHKREIERFLVFLESLVDADENRTTTELEFKSAHLSIGIVYVGIRSKLDERGLIPYLSALEVRQSHDIDTVYLAARGRNRLAIPRICMEARRVNLCQVRETYELVVRHPESHTRIACTICRVAMTPRGQ